MRILALECSAKSVSAALAEDGILIGESFLNVNQTHSETLMPLCEQMLRNASLTLKDIDALAITPGPGSFTGVRIGVSLVKGLAFANNMPVFCFSALEAMALELSGMPFFEGIICPLMDARCNQFYNAIFKIKNKKIERAVEDRIILADSLAKELEIKYNGTNTVILGDGSKLFYKTVLPAENIQLMPEHLLMQRAAAMAVFASEDSCGKVPVTPDLLKPVYLRKSQAEREKELKNNKSIFK